MFDFLRNLRKSEAEKRQEAITAYLDDALTAGERERLEQQMAADSGLRADMEQQQRVKLNVSRLPRVRAPRNFTLDPALYGRPARQSNARLYPAMRVATVLVGVFFIIAVGAEILTFSSQGSELNIANQMVGLSAEADVNQEDQQKIAQAAAAPAESELPAAEDIDRAIPATEEAAPITPEEEQAGAAPAEPPAPAADEEFAVAEEAVEESLPVVIVTAVVQAAEEIAEAEEAAPVAPEEEGEADGDLLAALELVDGSRDCAVAVAAAGWGLGAVVASIPLERLTS